jgi:hypothetical protein
MGATIWDEEGAHARSKTPGRLYDFPYGSLTVLRVSQDC